MGKWKIHTPEGVQDILVEECFLKRSLEEKARQVFYSYGYREIETPTLEFYDTFSAGCNLTPQESMFKFFDQQGRILVLRPDVTIPVARIAATKYKDFKYPLRLFYIANTFSYHEIGGGRQKEFTQAGVEILGVSTPEADAEVIATAIEAVKATGIENFQIDIGQVAFFKGLMEETGLSEEVIEQVRVLIDRKDYLAVEELVKGLEIRNELKELILGLPRLFGSVDVIDRVEHLYMNELNTRCLKALQDLRSVLEILEDYKLSQYVSIDLGMVQSINYYTGVIFRGFTYGVGFPILSGGRYDTLVGKFGFDCPATGFSMGINMLMMALDRQKIAIEKPSTDSLICYGKEGRKTALALREEFRKQGMSVEIDVTGESLPSVKQYATQKGIGGILYIEDKENIEVHNILVGTVEKTSMSQLLGISEGEDQA